MLPCCAVLILTFSFDLDLKIFKRSENLKTIKELADEFNVSKQAVRKRLTEEFRANHVGDAIIKVCNPSSGESHSLKGK